MGISHNLKIMVISHNLKIMANPHYLELSIILPYITNIQYTSKKFYKGLDAGYLIFASI